LPVPSTGRGVRWARMRSDGPLCELELSPFPHFRTSALPHSRTHALTHCSSGRVPPLRSGPGCARRRQRYNCCQRRRAPGALQLLMRFARHLPGALGSRPCGRASLTQQLARCTCGASRAAGRSSRLPEGLPRRPRPLAPSLPARRTSPAPHRSRGAAARATLRHRRQPHPATGGARPNSPSPTRRRVHVGRAPVREARHQHGQADSSVGARRPCPWRDRAGASLGMTVLAPRCNLICDDPTLALALALSHSRTLAPSHFRTSVHSSSTHRIDVRASRSSTGSLTESANQTRAGA
jgi:hypothetical protein